MKKASKVLTLILVFVLLAGVFSGCAMFTRNTARYRSLVAVTVGNEEITVGKILDSFNSYYNTYSSYLGQGITAEWLLQMAMQSVVTQAMKVDSYTSSATPETHALKDFCHNAQYLTQEEIEYSIKYVKYITFQSLDNSVQAILSADRTIGEEKSEDTSRDFTELDKLEAATYSEHTYRTRVFDDEAEKYFEKYYGGIDKIGLAANTGEYVYTSEQAAKAMLDNLNGRLDEEDAAITYSEYKNAQEKVIGQYQLSIKNSYGIDFEQFMVNQVADMVASVIVAKYDYSVNKEIDTTNLQATIKQLNDNLTINTESQAAGFALNDNFVEFIEGLSSTSYLYNVPQEYQRSETNKNGYIFVKNILIPFTTQQTATLSNLSKDLGGDTKNSAYVQLRNEFAVAAVAKDFTDKLEDDKYTEYRDLFEIVDGKLTVKEGGELSKVFKANGVVEGGDEAVIECMKRFNTDTAQHTAQYDYVIRVGDVPSDYTAKWVTEFVEAGNEVADLGKGHYALAISTYGVHIVYYVDDVKAQSFDFANNYLDTATPEYRLFKSYFSQQSSRLLNEKVEALQKAYLEENKIVVDKNFNRFLKDNSFEFDLIKYLSDEE